MAVTTMALPAPRARNREEVYRKRYLIAFVVTLASVLELLDTSIVNVAIPHMMGSLGATLDQIAWVSTGYVVANVIVLPITGWLAARFGRRRYFAASIALFTVASFFCGNAGSLGALVFWRIVEGGGGGALAIFGMGVVVGPTLGPTLGGYITDALGWPWIFYINIPLGMIALAMTLGYIRDSRFAEKISAVDWAGVALLLAGGGGLQTMLERGERLDWFESGQVVALAVVSVASLVLFVWHELR